MSTSKQFLIWLTAAAAAVTLLAGVMRWQQEQDPVRWSSFLVGNPDTGAKLFFGTKGCVQCHSIDRQGGSGGPDLGLSSTPKGNMSQLVSAMWNCAPRMWDKMRAQKLPYPDLTQEDMAHLFAFLYTVHYIEPPGEPQRGERLLAGKGCLRCHAVRGNGGKEGPDLATVAGVDTPILWVQAMWNHAPKMENRMRELRISWPKFEQRDMHDLLAYARTFGRMRSERGVLPADPQRGWKVFQTKSCIACHSVDGRGGKRGPDLGADHAVPLGLIEFAAVMWNHSPDMWKAPEASSLRRPEFSDKEMADLIAFLASLRYFEPGGSSHVGQTVFVERGCGRCHGSLGEGTSLGPALRKTSKGFSTIVLAAALWRHGPEMYQRTREVGVQWPNLEESDIGHLLKFLNTPGDVEH